MRRASLLAFGTACSLAACTFPEINLYVTSDGGASTSSTANGGAGGSTSTTTTSSGAAGGQGGSAGEAAGGAGGEGGSMCNGGGAVGGAGGGGGVGGVDPCNKDGDPHLAKEFPCCGDDCDDDNPDVYPSQTTYFDVPRPVLGGFDYDCDGFEEGDKTQLFGSTGDPDCSGALCLDGKGYDKFAKCGTVDTDHYFSCTPVVCTVEPATPMEALRCK